MLNYFTEAIKKHIVNFKLKFSFFLQSSNRKLHNIEINLQSFIFLIGKKFKCKVKVKLSKKFT